MNLRELRESDQEPIRRLLEATEFFRTEEVDVALELVDAALETPEQQDYIFAVAEGDGAVLGYVCWGETACTRGTYDLYWVAVAPGTQGKGVGRALMAHAEGEMRKAGGRLCVVETSGLPKYESTRAFYLRIAYTEEARIRDYYQSGDDLVIYTKKL
jgi:ribosomal protein S18 acetylase RimI-like enzyme